MSVQKYSTAKGARWSVAYTRPDGTRTQKRGFLTKTAAKAWETKLASDILTGQWVAQKTSAATFSTVGDQWLENTRARVKPSTFKPIEVAYRLRCKPTWGTTPINEIKHTELKTWILGLTSEKGGPLSASSMRCTLGVMTGILDDAVQDGIIGSNPAKGIKTPPKPRKKSVYLTATQLHALADECGDRRNLILLLGYVGLRWGEAIALTGEDVDVDSARITVSKNAVWVSRTIHVGTPKSGQSRTVPIPRFLLPEFATAVGNNTLLFPGDDGGYLPLPPSVDGWFQRAIKTSGVPRITVHDLRHTAASLAVQSGANVKAIQRMLGHASAAMTLDVYADLFDDDLDDVARRMDERARALNLI